jgi:hypothetical protein
MDDWAALRVALELVHVPWRVGLVRGQPLPEGVPKLLSVAVGDAESDEAAVEATGQPLDVIKQAATFFIQEILFAPGADSYRVLGAGPAATSGELRQNMALLMKWLHPDVAGQGDHSVFATRISAAWNTLKTPERRAAYDGELQAEAMRRGAGQGRDGASGTMPRSRRPRPHFASDGRRAGELPWLLAYLLGRPRR